LNAHPNTTQLAEAGLAPGGHNQSNAPPAVHLMMMKAQWSLQFYPPSLNKKKNFYDTQFKK
jgi:hypothetical protein